MKTIVRNFTSIFKKFVTANVLNLLGLSLAFASFFVIMTQVSYDLSYNKSFAEHENLFRMTMDLGPSEGHLTSLARPVIERLAVTSPHVISYGSYQGWVNFDQYCIGEKEFSLNERFGNNDFLSVFKPTVITGNLEGLKQRYNIVLPRSEAMRLFGTTDVVGQTLKYKWEDNLYYNVCAVIEDYPANNFLHGNCFIGTDYNKDSYNNWNYDAYIRVDDASNLPTVVQTLRRTAIELFKEKYNMTTQEEEDALQIIFTNVADAHFSKDLNKAAPGRSSVYLLICFSLLIVVIAAVNFMNFTLAETPMRIRSINTQKVLGATAAKLRASLLIEAVIISLIAFVVALLIVYLAHDFGLQELVQASILLQDHPLLIAITLALSIVVGILAGAYPSYYVTSFPPALVLKGSFGLSPKGRVLRTVLICLQFVVSFMLVIGVGIMYLQSYLIYHTDYGFDKDEVLTLPATPATRQQLDAVDAELRSISGIEGASITQGILGSSDSYQTWGRGSGDKHMNFTCLFVDWRFLDVMGIDVVEGRNFRESDGDVYILNESAKKQYDWLRVNEPITDGDLPVIGFCKDIKYSTLRVDDSELPIAFFVPKPGGEYAQWSWQNNVLVRVSKGVDKRQIKQKVLDVVNRIEKEYTLDLSELNYIDEVLERSYQQESLFTKQILLFSLLAILISIIGVFGLTMFESEYRRKEIGIRKVFGSSTREILQMFNKRYLYILLGCFVVAAPVGYLLGQHWLEGFAVRTAINPLLFLVSFLLVTLITMLTVTYQSWKNASENPINSIKTE
ncbi:MAG: FtsX-like permease family protein [Bacteroidaceae bacterium]|nr:FtsX-like permease family protein [Bacteroidaceae bacterium]